MNKEIRYISSGSSVQTHIYDFTYLCMYSTYLLFVRPPASYQIFATVPNHLVDPVNLSVTNYLREYTLFLREEK